MSYPKSEETVRPYRLWDATAKRPVRYRYYSDSKRAHDGALIEARWNKKPGFAIEVYNAINGGHLGTYAVRLGKDGKLYLDIWMPKREG